MTDSKESPPLSTKLSIPWMREDFVPRPHLHDRLTEGANTKLLLISAPAGFGKTTLLGAWTRHIEEPVAWLSLSEGENDPARFLAYFILALQTIDATVGRGPLELLQTPQPPPLESLSASVINEVDAWEERATLILDDCHHVDEPSVYGLIDFILGHMPRSLQLALSGRVDPPLPLAHLRAQGLLTEIRAADLRFSQEETALFLNGLMGLNLSEHEIAALRSRTEGWIAGLQLAALSLRDCEDKGQFIRSFTGGHHFIIDFLVEEVMSRLDQTTRRFLLYTSILDRLSAPICDAVLGISTSREMLRRLENANLFLIPLDEERRWYRYHHLFAEFLRQRLSEQEPDRIPALHRLASRWCWRNGLAEKAAEHALSAGEPEMAAELMEGLAEDYWRRGEPTTILKWMRRLPAPQVRNRPELAIHCAWSLFLNGRNDEAQHLLEAAEEAQSAAAEGDVSSGSMTEAERDNQHERSARVASVRSAIAFRQGDGAAVLEQSHRALALLPNRNSIWGGIAATNLGMAQDLSGDTAAACETVSRAVDYSKECGNTYMILSTSLHLGTLLMRRGQLHQVHDMCRDLMILAEERGVLHTEMAGCLYDELGLVLCEWNELGEAMEFLRRGSALSEQGFDTGVMGWSYLTMVRALFTQGDLDGAQAIIQKMDRLQRESDVPPWYESPKEAWKARVMLARGELDAAARWAADRDLLAGGEVSYLREDEHIAFARILLQQGRLAETNRLLAQLIEMAERGGRIDSVAQCLLIAALALHTQQDMDGALELLSRALALTEPGGYIRIYLDEGDDMLDLLRRVTSRGTSPEYVCKLLAAFGAGSKASPGQLAEPLTDREYQVLRLLATELSGPEIARQLTISENTLRTHTRNLYSKLGAHTRRQALVIAEDLNLI